MKIKNTILLMMLAATATSWSMERNNSENKFMGLSIPISFKPSPKPNHKHPRRMTLDSDDLHAGAIPPQPHYNAQPKKESMLVRFAAHVDGFRRRNAIERQSARDFGPEPVGHNPLQAQPKDKSLLDKIFKK